MNKIFRLIFIILLFILFGSIYLSKNSLAAPFGNFLIFNGGFVKAQNQNLISPGSFSFNAWIKPKSVSGIKHILTIGNLDSKTINYQIGINGGSLSLYFTHSGNAIRVITSGNIQNDIWQNIQISINQSATTLSLDGNTLFTASGISSLNPVGPDIILGSGFPFGSGTGSNNFKGDMDQIQISTNQGSFIIWNLDQNRGEITTNDSSGNGINGTLTGGDSIIHYNGVSPTPTKFVLPTLPPIRSISLPIPLPTSGNSQPDFDFNFEISRNIRPQLPR